ncbi:MAG: hypothetical protein WKF94_17990 [Solirubrobacteraceae bacterium]
MKLEPFFDDIVGETPLPTARAAARPLAAIMEDRYEYPDRTAFISADSVIFGASFAEAAFAEHRPVLVVMPDGVEFLYEPAPGLVAHVRRALTARFASQRLRSMGPLVTDGDSWVDPDSVSMPGYRRRMRVPQPA